MTGIETATVVVLTLGNLAGLALSIVQKRQIVRLAASMRTARCILMCGNCNGPAADAVQELAATLAKEGLG
jgi:hypothetical protein